MGAAWARCQQMGKEFLAQTQTDGGSSRDVGATELISARTSSRSYKFGSWKSVPSTSRICTHSAHQAWNTGCPSPGAVLLWASDSHLTRLSASRVSESLVPRSPFAQHLPPQTKTREQMTRTHSTLGVRSRGAWRNEAVSRDGEVRAGCLGEGPGTAVARSGH